MTLTPLYNWYERNKRDLPWRDTCDAYKIWLSEIILQQTRVAQGLDYYLRFTTQYPTLHELAMASEDEVLKLWQGLGYYSRARNLLKAAQTADRLWHEMPNDYQRLRSLPGIGDYTAAAIASFAFGLPYAVLDGNVFRVLSRLFADPTPIDSTQGKKSFSRRAQQLLDPMRSSLHNQAMMELGALVCLPSEPLCQQCPLTEMCEAHRRECQHQFPVKQKSVAKRTRFFNYLYRLFHDSDGGHHLFLHRRTPGDIWAGLYEPPLIESDRPLTREELCANDNFKRLLQNSEHVTWTGDAITLTHILTHQRIEATFHVITVNSVDDVNLQGLTQVSENDLERYAVSRLTDKFQSLLSSRYHDNNVSQ